MPSNKPQLNMRVSEEAFRLVRELSSYYGVSMVAVIEMLLRDRARDVGLLSRPRSLREMNMANQRHMK